MIERNRIIPPPLPLPPGPASNVRRKRNRMLLFIILALTAIALWTGIWKIEQFVPELELMPEEIVEPSITGLHPIVLTKQNELIAETAALGITILITDGYRSIEEQDQIYAQGRTTPGSIVTQAKGGSSYHNYGLAIDFALRTKKGEVIWDMSHDGNGNGKADWLEVVEVAKKLGFSWGGDWEGFPDYPHLQMDFGYSLRKLKKGHYPPLEVASHNN
jgi:peptidoglycan L-alanyl-D-glutamate endopeptidase CwlK